MNLPDSARAASGGVLVLFESTARGAVAVREAAALARARGAGLTVITQAALDTGRRGCGPSPDAYNDALLEAARGALNQARELLGPPGSRARFTVFAEPTPGLASWVIEDGFSSVVLPRRRLARGGHPAARKLRRLTDAEVRVVG